MICVGTCSDLQTVHEGLLDRRDDDIWIEVVN